MTAQGHIIILNGAPRAGKSSIVAAIQETFRGMWMNLGVDAFVKHITPPRYRPGIGLRPGGERPDLESIVPTLYAALYESIAAHSRLGLNVVVDVGHHDGYTTPCHILMDCARRLNGLPVLFVGVRCKLDVILARRSANPSQDYLTVSDTGDVPRPVQLWQDLVHVPGIYDLEVDTSAQSPEACADAIKSKLAEGVTPPTAFQKIAAMGRA